MTIQASIIEALKASQLAHQAGLSEVKALRAQRAALAEKIKGLEGQIAVFKAESVKIVEPATVQPLLDELARAVAATQEAITPTPKPAPAPPAAPKPANVQPANAEPKAANAA